MNTFRTSIAALLLALSACFQQPSNVQVAGDVSGGSSSRGSTSGGKPSTSGTGYTGACGSSTGAGSSAGAGSTSGSGSTGASGMTGGSATGSSTGVASTSGGSTGASETSGGSGGGSTTGATSSGGSPFSTLSLVAGQPGGAGSLDAVGTAARFGAPIALASDGAGHLFVADSNNYTIREVDVASGTVSTVAGSTGHQGNADGAALGASFTDPEGLAFCAGQLFVTDYDSNTVRVLSLSSNTVSTLAGAAGVSGSADGVGAAARFNNPYGIACDGAGHVFVADTGNFTLRKIDAATGTVTTLAGLPGSPGSADGTGTSARFRALSDLVWDGAGHLFVSDGFTIREVVVATGAVTTLAGTAGVRGTADGVGAAASFQGPFGLALDGAGHLFVADQPADTLREIDLATATVSTPIGSPGNPGLTEGAFSATRLDLPIGLASDGAGNLFVSEDDPTVSFLGVFVEQVLQINLGAGTVASLAGSVGHAGSANGTGSAATFYSPEGIAFDGNGHLLVVDTASSLIREIDLASAAVTTLAGAPETFGEVDGTGPAATFDNPVGVACDGAGHAFVVDDDVAKGVSTVREIDLATAAVTTLAGAPPTAGGSVGSADGVGAAAQFDGPASIAWDGAGHLFVADSMNATIREVDVATQTVSTLAGSPQQKGSVDGVGAAARFWFPYGIASDGAGRLFVADNETIREVDVSPATVTTLAGSPGLRGSTDGVGSAARFFLGISPLFGIASLAGLASDGAGHLFVADGWNSAVREIDVATAMVITLAGVPGQAGDLPGPLPAFLNTPAGLAFAPGTGLFVTDDGENVVLDIH